MGRYEILKYDLRLFYIDITRNSCIFDKVKYLCKRITIIRKGHKKEKCKRCRSSTLVLAKRLEMNT